MASLDNSLNSKVASVLAESLFAYNKRNYSKSKGNKFLLAGYLELKNYVEALLNNMSLLTPFDSENCVLSLIYFDRLMKYSSVNILEDQVLTYKLFIVCLLMSLKFHQDIYNSTVLILLSGLSTAELSILEAQALETINYNLYIEENEFNKYYSNLKIIKTTF